MPETLVLPNWWVAAPASTPASAWANDWVDYQRSVSVGAANEDPNNVLGPADGTTYAMGAIGDWIIVDMGPDGEAICNKADNVTGNDLIVNEGGVDETYTVYVSWFPYGPWSYVGQGNGGDYFDISGTGLDAVRFVRIVNDSSATHESGAPGADIDSVRANSADNLCDPLAGQLPADQTFGEECPIANCEDIQPSVGKPINTYSGNYHYRLPTFGIAAVGSPLDWELSYNSQATDGYTTPVGYGWTHNYAMELAV
jgi:hypothetical protein